MNRIFISLEFSYHFVDVAVVVVFVVVGVFFKVLSIKYLQHHVTYIETSAGLVVEQADVDE